jgi:hypothetical protein
MRTLLVSAVVLAVAAWFGSASSRSEAGEAAGKSPQLGKLRHVVLFSFKEGTSPEEIKKIEDGFRALPSKIPTVVGFEWGTNNSPEGLADGFTHCFLVTFNDDAGRAVYLPHKAHKEFVEILLPHLEKVLVIDYVVKD